MKTQFSDSDRHFLRLALREARKGLGRTSPNPCVGALIVGAGEIVARGYHRQAGGPHAEIEALRKAGERARGATLYVTLEPCNHTGRTPPCSRAVVAAGIRRVCIGMLDPNPRVAGGGADFLRRAGLEVSHGLLEERCRELNLPFITHVTKGRPWVVLKAGLTLDGRISFRKHQGDQITGPESLRQVHLLRDRCAAILVGINTVLSDDPSLTARLAGRRTRNPIRVILDTNLRISPTARVVAGNRDGLTWIFCAAAAEEKARLLRALGVTVIAVGVDQSGRLDLGEVLRELGARGVSSLLVEGGAAVHGSFLRSGLADRLQLFYAPVVGGDGGQALIDGYRNDGGKDGAIRLTAVRRRQLGDDLMISGDLIFPAGLDGA